MIKNDIINDIAIPAPCFNVYALLALLTTASANTDVTIKIKTNIKL